MSLKKLNEQLEGEVRWDLLSQRIYSNDASAYEERPQGVVFPKNVSDLQKVVQYARAEKKALIPRAAGTSLAGQVVGSGLVVDISRHFTQILDWDEQEGWAWVEPGVIRDELNAFFQPKGWMFGPETSTSNRCMLGGMIGNNSCGLRSVVFGSVREHLLEVEMVNAEGQIIRIKNLSATDWEELRSGEGTWTDLERKTYLFLLELLTNPGHQEIIRAEYPKPEIPRRNTGYALDMLLSMQPFHEQGKPFNLCALIAGSEGTLGLITKAKLNLSPLLPPHQGVLPIHFHSIHDALLANVQALDFNPTAGELMDHYILDCTKTSIEHQANRFFIKGEPQAILIVEFCEHSEEALEQKAQQLEEKLRKSGLGIISP